MLRATGIRNANAIMFVYWRQPLLTYLPTPVLAGRLCHDRLYYAAIYQEIPASEHRG